MNSDDPLFHQALDLAGKLAAVRGIVLSDNEVAVTRDDLRVVLNRVEPGSDASRCGEYRRLRAAAGLPPRDWQESWLGDVADASLAAVEATRPQAPS